jgi:hypothetical protein
MPARKLASDSAIYEACKTESGGDMIDWTQHKDGLCGCQDAKKNHVCGKEDHKYCYNGAKWKDIEFPNACTAEPTDVDPNSSAVSAYGFTALVLVLITV